MALPADHDWKCCGCGAPAGTTPPCACPTQVEYRRVYGVEGTRWKADPAPTAISGDTFNGDDETLVKSIRALVQMDDDDCAKPPLSWAAKTLLIAAANRLLSTPPPTPADRDQGEE